MSNRIDEIMQLSDTGYIEEYDDIAVILEHFLSYTVEELNNALPKNCDMLEFAVDVMQKLGDIEITDSSQVEKLKLSDILCIMKHFEKNFSDPDEILLSYMKNLRSNIASLKGLPWATLFMSISVNSLMSFFHEKTNDCKYSKIYREICELALGYTKRQSFFKVVFPQAARNFLPVIKGEFISLVKMTSIVGYITIQDLTKASDIIRSRTYEAFFPLIVTAMIYFAISCILTIILGRIEIRLDPKRRKKRTKEVTL